VSLSENVLIQYTLSERGQPAMAVPREPSLSLSAERVRNTFQYFKDFGLKKGSSQGQNLAVTVVFVTNSPDSGRSKARLWPRVQAQIGETPSGCTRPARERHA